jgi:hypothetical protein
MLAELLPMSVHAPARWRRIGLLDRETMESVIQESREVAGLTRGQARLNFGLPVCPARQ